VSKTTIDVGELLTMLDREEGVTVIDVRSPEEFAEWSIPGALNLPVETIETHLDEVPSDVVVVLVCASGNRAEQARRILASQGLGASVLEGGMQAWGRAYDEVALVAGDVTIVQIRRRGKGCLGYVVGSSDRCVVIDPSADIERPIAIAAARGWRIAFVADTHLHADHVSGARLLAEAVGAELVLSDADAYAFDVAPIASGARLEIGPDRALEVEVLKTPGHTTGSTTFALDGLALFTGDTLFVESVGRPDLADKAEEFADDLYRSLHERVLSHDDATLVLPAHFGPSVEVHPGRLVGARLGELRRELAPLSLSEPEFVAWATSEVPDRPPNYTEIVRANQGLLRLSSSEVAALEFGPNRCAVSSPSPEPS
jgi:glyoxylase-like metal-dependent hydrolase (beta-lactamase superfamily II)/rhodanese-related sulfurtransferase